MTPLHVFLIISGLAYFFFAVTPEPTTFGLSKWVERVLFSLAGAVILLSLWLGNRFLFAGLGIVYTGASVFSYLGYMLWRTRWSEDPIDEVQMVMFIWDWGISACFFWLSLT